MIKKSLVIAATLALGLTSGTALAQAATASGEGATSAAADMTAEQRAAYETWPRNLREDFDAWPAGHKSYFWSLDGERRMGYWALNPEQRSQVEAMSEEHQEGAWQSIMTQLSAHEPESSRTED